MKRMFIVHPGGRRQAEWRLWKKGQCDVKLRRAGRRHCGPRWDDCNHHCSPTILAQFRSRHLLPGGHNSKESQPFLQKTVNRGFLT